MLQGGFLLASQICQPEPLSSLKKEDWDQIGSPIVNAVKEICGHTLKNTKDRVYWRKKILCIVWSKLLEMRNTEDIDVRWKDDPLFAVQNGLPDINHTLLFELVKSMGFSTIYVELLLCFQPSERCKELELLVNHVTSNSTEADVKLFLEVWWELLKGSRGDLDTLDELFTAQCSRLLTTTTEPSPLASKRFKPDPESSSSCVVNVLFEGLREIKERLTSSEICYFALSNCLDTLYTHYLLNSASDLPIELKLQNVSHTVNLRKKNESDGFDLVEVIREVERDLAAVLTPAVTKPCGMTFIQAMQVTLEIICSWEVMGLLKMPTSDPSATSIRLKESLSRVHASLEKLSHAKDLVGNGQTLNNLRVSLKGLLTSLSFEVPESSTAELANMSMVIIDNNLNGFQGLPELFASKLSQDFNEIEWIECLERNKSTFQTQHLVMTLTSTLIAKSQSDADVQHCKKLKDVIVDIFCHLSLPDKNGTLSQILSISTKGLHGFLPGSVTAGFAEELNLSFNSIIQSGTNSSLDAAVSAVAQVAFQNPEAALRRCCQMAVVNLGSHTLIAEILRHLPGLMSSPKVHKDNLVCRCLRDTVWSKLSSTQEENQFLQFVTELMKFTGPEGDKLSFLPPQEVLRVFVQPYLLSAGSCNLELCLRLLQSTLTQDSKSDSVHWIMTCSPFPLLYCLALLLNECCRCWEVPVEGDIPISIESKELLLSVLHTLGTIVGNEVVRAPDDWSRALFWLYSKVEELDWTVRFCLKDVWGEHFKYEVPSSLLAVCDLPEQEWAGLHLPQYGQGTGLLAWLECCTLSDCVHKTMMDSLSLNLMKPDEVNMFSKGLLVAVSQILPWCTAGEWDRLLKVLQELLQSNKLYVPFSLEYVDFLPLLDLRSFSVELRLSVFLLRIFQLLCSSSCSDWLSPQGWAHTGRLYATAMRGVISAVCVKLPLPPTTGSPKDLVEKACSQEVLFVLGQLFCHVLHVQVMIPGQPEALFLCALEILTHYEAAVSAYPDSCTALQGLNTRHFFTTIADNLQCADMKAVLHQKIAQL